MANRLVSSFLTKSHLMDDPEPEQLLSVSEQRETDDDVTRDDVQVPEELGQDARDVGERALQHKRNLNWLGRPSSEIAFVFLTQLSWVRLWTF